MSHDLQPSLLTRGPVLAITSSWPPLASTASPGEAGLAHSDWDRGGCLSHQSAGLLRPPETSVTGSWLHEDPSSERSQVIRGDWHQNTLFLLILSTLVEGTCQTTSMTMATWPRMRHEAYSSNSYLLCSRGHHPQNLKPHNVHFNAKKVQNCRLWTQHSRFSGSKLSMFCDSPAWGSPTLPPQNSSGPKIWWPCSRHMEYMSAAM